MKPSTADVTNDLRELQMVFMVEHCYICQDRYYINCKKGVAVNSSNEFTLLFYYIVALRIHDFKCILKSLRS